MQRTRVLHFIDTGGLYGAENVILTIARETLKNNKYEPVVGCIAQHKDVQILLADTARKFGIEAEVLVINNKRFPLHIVKVARLIKRMRIGLIHSHGYKPSVVGFFISKYIQVPLLATCHLWFSGKNPSLKYSLMTKLEAFLYRYFPKIVCVSKPIKTILTESGVRDEQVIIIDNGISINDYRAKRDEQSMSIAKEKLSIPNNNFVILNVGRLSEQKAQQNIIFIAEKLKINGIDDLVFLIAGEGEKRNYLEKLIKQRKLDNEVRVLGFRDDIRDILEATDIFFLPSLDEGLPMSLLEAIASKVPVVVTPVGAIPNLINHGIDGLIAKINDIDSMCSAILRIKNNRDQAIEFSKNAYEKLRLYYSSEIMYRQYEKIYDKILLDVNTQKLS